MDSPIRLCALRVEFQVDSETGTTGDGTMGSGFPDTLVIDPLPHDREYFQDHLRFLNNYYSTISKGRLSFSNLDVFPSGDSTAYQLAFPMWHYNYNTESELLNQRLVELFAEAVTLANADVDFSDYDAIIVFHAGVGKDFNVGFDDTPFDIPSAYISERDLENYSGEIPSEVTRGLILPEGQNQKEVLDFGVELSLNGVMIKLFGNWLGLPDLFDTATGNSGIGRWGMMDQGSGNVNALVPAMPDAWSRVFMGWEKPEISIPPGRADVLQIARFGVEGIPEIVKIPITPREYYLLENRDADADSVGFVTLLDRDGREMQVDHRGNISLEAGFKVAVQASHYDFGIPGSGILIWHIDENVIDEKYESNSVNTDPRHRGVALVEADGSQDIGVQFGFATAGSGTELGIQDDAWYAGNRTHRDANGGIISVRFNDRSRPSAKLYDRSFTYLELTAFSSVDSVMSFAIRSTTTAEGFPIELASSPNIEIADMNGDSIPELILIEGDSLFVFGFDMSLVPQARIQLPRFMRFADQAAVTDFDDDGYHEVILQGSAAGILRFVDNDYALEWIGPEDLPGIPSYVWQVRPCETPSGEARVAVFSRPDDLTEYLNSVFLLDKSLSFLSSSQVGNSVNFQSLWNADSYPCTGFVFSSEEALSFFSVNDSSLVESWYRDDLKGVHEITVLREPDQNSIFVEDHGYINLITGEDLCLLPECIAPGVDWDGDGIPDGGGLEGAHQIERENAPQLNVEVERVVDLDIDNKPDIFGLGSPDVFGNYSRIYAADHDGPLFAGFPIASPGTPNRSLFDWGDDDFLYYLTTFAVDTIHYLSMQRLPVQTLGSERFSYTEADAIINIGNPRPQVHNRSDWIYCWPNPASDISHIRFTTSSSAEAAIKIYDLAGRRVASLTGSSGIPGQFEINWDVRNVSSGVYIGQAELKAGGVTQTSEIKIAVVK